MSRANEEMKDYFKAIDEHIERIYEVARRARALGMDPEFEPEIPRAGDLASRVEQLVGPKGVADVIREMEKIMDREELALKVAEMVIDGRFGRLDEEKAAEQALRTALAILTEGIVIAPLEGITRVEIRRNPDNTRYLSIWFASPIRAAGGTAAALSVLAGDFVRRKLFLSHYKPTPEEVERFVEEVEIYGSVVAHEQYKPPADHIRLAIQNIPVEITGEPTERDVTVTAFRDIERIGHNMVRGGAVLALTEGVLQKASKIMKYVEKLGIDGWGWLSSVVPKVSAEESEAPVFPKGDRYLSEVIAGRPIFSHPGTEGQMGRRGGFRLRYGRARNTGIAAIGIHPATMVICDDFIAVGTQLKVERPGKGGAAVPVDSIEGPVVKLADGSVIQLSSAEEALRVRDKVVEILCLGDMLVGYGEFLENNHPLMPAGYCEELWSQEVERALAGKNLGEIAKHLRGPYPRPDPVLAVRISDELKVPLHPAYTYPYHDLEIEELVELARWLVRGKAEFDGEVIRSLRVPVEEIPKRILEELCVPHRVEGGEAVIEEHAYPLCRSLGLISNGSLSLERFERVMQASASKDIMDIMRELARFPIRKKAPTRIGARMGRPEKAKEREMSPPVHALFPVGFKGGATRSIPKAAQQDFIEVELANMVCPSCGWSGFTRRCKKCGAKAEPVRLCQKCGRPVEDERCPVCNARAEFFSKRRIDLRAMFEEALEKIGERYPDLVKGVQGMTSDWKIPEPLEKGILRAKHGVQVFKDGTVRFDATNVPLTHFKPREIGVSVEKLVELGYTVDIDGNPLERDDQIVELKVQDVIISKSCAEYLLAASRFVDELLEKVYGLEPYYMAKDTRDLIGHIVLGLAPHTSVGIAGRIIGFVDASVCYAHPFFHAAKRRDCFSYDETLPIFDGFGWKIVKIGEFIEDLFKKHRPRKTEFGDLVVEIDKYQTLTLTDDLKYELRPIVAFSKHPEQNHLVKVITKDGRELVTSGLHPFLDENQQKVRAFEVRQVVRPMRFSIKEKEVRELDLLDYADDETMVVGVKDRLKEYLDAHGLKQTAEKIGLPKTTLFDYYMRDSVPARVLVSLGIQIPADARLKARHDTVILPRLIKVDRDFLRLLGLYVAEGHLRKEEGSFYQVSFAVTRNKREVERAIAKVFGISPSRSKYAVTISSRLVYNLFKGLGCGERAEEKRVPSFVLSLPLDQVKYFLQGYFEGDGGISKPCGKGSTPEVSCTSASKMLLRDIEFLLTRFGLPCSWQKDQRRMGTGKVADFYKKRGRVLEWTCYKLRMYGSTAREFCEKIGFWWPGKRRKAERILKGHKFRSKRLDRRGDAVVSAVKEIRIERSPQPLYNFTVKETHNAIVSGCSVKQCDGDEDCVMLLLDALLNFSKRFLPSKRGGTMDAPLILNTRINPTEIDKQAHNMDVMKAYPLEFYEATLRYARPQEVLELMTTAGRKIGTENEYSGFGFSSETTDISAGPKSTRYATLATMEEKISAQLTLARKIRAVDERDVAERLIKHHFIPDLKGNLRTFATQKFRCTSCNQTHRRIPLSGKCTRCGGKLVLTVTRGGVEKYLRVAMDVAEEYHVSEYTKQRLELTRKDIESMFESDASKQLSLADFL
ncbi:MAG: DNA polymerase II large subunit [Candidatus Hadarchaeales archaeon]